MKIKILLALLFFVFSPSIQAKTRTYVVKKNETLKLVAMRLYGDARHWKSLVKANKLLPPYTLHEGQALKFNSTRLAQQKGEALLEAYWKKNPADGTAVPLEENREVSAEPEAKEPPPVEPIVVETAKPVSEPVDTGPKIFHFEVGPEVYLTSLKATQQSSGGEANLKSNPTPALRARASISLLETLQALVETQVAYNTFVKPDSVTLVQTSQFSAEFEAGLKYRPFDFPVSLSGTYGIGNEYELQNISFGLFAIQPIVASRVSAQLHFAGFEVGDYQLSAALGLSEHFSGGNGDWKTNCALEYKLNIGVAHTFEDYLVRGELFAGLINFNSAATQEKNIRGGLRVMINFDLW